MSKTVCIGDFLTTEEISRAEEMYKTTPTHQFATEFSEEVIEPNLERISLTLGQDCNPKYLAYLVLYALSRAKLDSPMGSTDEMEKYNAAFPYKNHVKGDRNA